MSLTGDEGYPASRGARVATTMDGWLAAGISASALVGAVLALVMVTVGEVTSGVTAEAAGGQVLAVEPGSIGWQDSIRQGQTVVSLRAADEVGGWRIVTEAGNQIMESAVARHERKLRANWPLAAGALGSALLSAALFRRQRRAAQLAACVAAGLGAVPMAVTANQPTSILVLGMAALLPALWLDRWSRWPLGVRIGLLAGAGGVVLTWVLAGRLHLPQYDVIDDLRFGATVLLGASALAIGTVEPRLDAAGWLRDPQASSAISLALLVSIGLALFAVVHMPLEAVAAIALVALIVLPRLRRLVSTGLDRLVFAGERERLAHDAAEAERTRLAREIHDAPLQELSGVIRQLDLAPGVASQTRALRDVAEQLRSIATTLRPPALDDLGLAATLRFVGQRAQAESGGNVQVEVVDRGDPEQRPPPEVELAMVRIAQEALANAVHHSGASAIRLEATVSTTWIELVIVDDGSGVDARTARSAQARGQMGLVSMERRAQAIGASFDFESGPQRGTRIVVLWSA